jgi:CheY-like chemotaxis protein
VDETLIKDSHRILIVDDNEAIHEDYIKILSPEENTVLQGLEDLELALFEEKTPKKTATVTQPIYRIDSAFQGQMAVDMVEEAAEQGDPYALVLMDVRMPPGINGIEAISRIWRNRPFVEMVIITAFSDYSWEQILHTIGSTDRLMFLRKPFDQVTVKQMTLALTKKYNLHMKVKTYLNHLEHQVKARNTELETMVRALKEMA